MLLWYLILLLNINLIISYDNIKSSINIYNVHTENLLSKINNNNNNNNKRHRYYDIYEGAVLSVQYNEPIYIKNDNNELISMNNIKNTTYLYDIITLKYGYDHFFVSRPPSTTMNEHIPTYLIPLYNSHDTTSLSYLFNTAHGKDIQANELRYLLILKYKEHGDKLNIFESHDIIRQNHHHHHHVESFYTPLSIDNDQHEHHDNSFYVDINGEKLYNFQGKPLNKIQKILKKINRNNWKINENMFDIANTIDKKKLSSFFDHSIDHPIVHTVDLDTKPRIPLQIYDCNSIAVDNLNRKDNDYLNTLLQVNEEITTRSREQMFALMEVVAKVRTAEEIKASQVLELISDPIIHIVVPACVQTAIEATKDPIIEIVKPLVEQIVTPPLIEPVRQSLIPTGAWLELDSKIIKNTTSNIANNMNKKIPDMDDLVDRLHKSVAKKLRKKTRHLIHKHHNHTHLRAHVEKVRQRFRKTMLSELKHLLDSDKPKTPSENIIELQNQLKAQLPSNKIRKVDVDLTIMSESSDSIDNVNEENDKSLPKIISSNDNNALDGASNNINNDNNNNNNDNNNNNNNNTLVEESKNNDTLTNSSSTIRSSKINEKTKPKSFSSRAKSFIQRQMESLRHRFPDTVTNTLSKLDHFGFSSIGSNEYREIDDTAFLEERAGEAPIEDEGKFSGTAFAEVPDYVTRGTALQVFDNIALTTGDNLRHGVNRTIVRQATREISTSLTESLTFHLVDMISKRIHRTLTHMCTHSVTRPLIPILSHSLSCSISHAMTRKTQYDYYCYYCLIHPAKLYCPYCYESFTLEQHLDHYSVYYAAYYSKYYESFYGELYADKVSRDYVMQNPFIPDGEGEQREAQGQLTIDRYQFLNEELKRNPELGVDYADPKVYHENMLWEDLD